MHAKPDLLTRANKKFAAARTNEKRKCADLNIEVGILRLPTAVGAGFNAEGIK